MRYLLFIRHPYNPSGGWGDFRKASDELDDLYNYLKNDLKLEDFGNFFEIVDLKHMEVIFTKQIDENGNS